MRGICWLFVLIVVQFALNSPEKLARARPLIAVAAFGLLWATAPPAGALDASPSAILSSPDGFDGKSVTIHGTITNLRETVSRRGNPYYTLDLSDGRRAIRVSPSEKLHAAAVRPRSRGHSRRSSKSAVSPFATRSPLHRSRVADAGG